MLSPYRVLDLSDERGLMCGQILADLGADVIQIEPPGGSSARDQGPWLAGRDGDREASLHWWAYARNKRGIVLDLETSQGRDDLRRLVTTADILVESEAPGRMADLELDYPQLATINPGLIHVSITPYGRTGPKANDAATDLTLHAASGFLHMTGDLDRAPVRTTVPQAYQHGGADGAGAALIALHERHRSGLGQHIDISIQQSLNQACASQMLSVPLGGPDVIRASGGISLGGLNVRFVWPAKDGFISLTHLFGTAVGPFTQRLMDWMYEEGACDQALRDTDWIGYADGLLTGRIPFAEFEEVKGIIAEFTSSKTKEELFAAGRERRLLIVPVSTIPDMIENANLAHRDYWTPVERPDGGTANYPGAFVRPHVQPLSYRRPAPLLGQHSDEVLAEIADAAFSAQPIPDGPNGLPLADVKILDFMWVMAGPAATRVLADYGATIVRVESTKRPETARTIAPFHGGVPGLENSGLFENLNGNKLGLTLNMATPEAREVAKDLVRWADAVCESFSPGAMQRWGLDYEALSAINPSVIALSSCLFGQTGPYSGVAGFGTMGAAAGGFIQLAGYPDRPPAGPAGAYTDYVSPRFTVVALMAALDHRRRTGQGQYIDQSQIEAALHFMAPALLDYDINGHAADRDANHDPQMAPHGVYPCQGDDRWIAIACRDDRDWQALCTCIDRADLRDAAEYQTLDGRLSRTSALDEAIAVWTRGREAEEAERTLQGHGIPAAATLQSATALEDTQLQHRGHFARLPHPIHGETIIEASRFVLSRTPAQMQRSGPTCGQHNQEILQGILGYDDDRVAELAAAGALD